MFNFLYKVGKLFLTGPMLQKYEKEIEKKMYFHWETFLMR